MKILIFGASGATGYNLVSQALRQEHFVTAFVRDPSKLKIQHSNIKVFEGNIIDYHRVNDAVKDQEVVFSTLGASSPFKRDFTLIKGIQNIVTALTNQDVRRFVYQSFIGVRENRKELGFILNRMMPLILRSVIADHKAKEEIIMNSKLDWTVVRCAILTNGSITGKYRDGEHVKSSSLFPLISRADAADFMLKQIADEKYMLKTPGIMY